MVVIVGGGGKGAIVTSAINHRHHWQYCNQHHWLNPTAAAIDDDCYCCHQLHCHCHTANNDDHQKPMIIVCHQRLQWLQLSTEAAVTLAHISGRIFKQLLLKGTIC
jgi:hypothetical protein